MARLWKFWQCVICTVKKLIRAYFPFEAHDVRVRRLATGWSLVTFRYQGHSYRGHLPPGVALPRMPWFRGARRCMKRPTHAVDSNQVNVLEGVREFWGPLGDWNGCLGMEMHGPSVDAFAFPLRLRFNDGTRCILQGGGVDEGHHGAGRPGAEAEASCHSHQV